MLSRDLHKRVDGIEARQTAVETSLNELRSDVETFGGKIDKLADSLSATGERAAGRADAIATGLREERRSWMNMALAIAGAGAALFGTIAATTSGLTGPYREKINQTAAGQADDTVKIAAVREVLAEQGAAIGRNGDSIDIAREKNRSQDEQLRQLQHDQAYASGWLTARLGFPGH